MIIVELKPDTRKAFLKAQIIICLGTLFFVAAVIVEIILPRPPVGTFGTTVSLLGGTGLTIIFVSFWWIHKFNLLYRRDKTSTKTVF